jgi:hypothetical protein
MMAIGKTPFVMIISRYVRFMRKIEPVQHIFYTQKLSINKIEIV